MSMRVYYTVDMYTGRTKDLADACLHMVKRKVVVLHNV